MGAAGKCGLDRELGARPGERWKGKGLVGLSGGWLAQGGSLCHRQRWCALRAGGGGRGRLGERAAGQDFENAQEALRKGTEAGLAESQAALDAAKQKLAAAIEEARKKRKAADAEKGSGRPQRDLLADVEDRLSGLGDRIAKGISVTGTFSAAAVSGLGTGGDTAERTASATEATAKNTKRLLDASADNGLRFA